MSEEELKDQESQEEPLTEEEPVAFSCESCNEAITGWKRALADYENLKKDLMKERVAIRSAAKEDVAEELIAVLDNFDQAAKFQPSELSKEAETWAMGLMHVRNQLESVMTDLGLSPFGESGDVFDPTRHEAAAERSEDDKPDQTILEVAARGWKLSDKIVRPAKVVINNLN
ncbi:nucleotide exchange factor GrpE [Candidatus Uhrbacteria bacterium CG_4_9_14_3_um_filter_50_9]|uniref:Protein GrpE n=1 Tax=Candidatus Uhrbacteria bacterium CG_4_9_14_3_um_filter_50_9 TaxID=1975035 RepID=A0A2M7XBC7_9BACT|nr:MAG: nucleotide exchange factor GrpE [Candidatus Uhrbacteria bacterium CG_4_9_14_3_um_filter_50_9]